VVNEFIKKNLNPFIISAFIIAFCVYCLGFKIKNTHIFRSILCPLEIEFIEGKVISSPNVTSSGKFYSCKLQVFKVKSKKIQKTDVVYSLTSSSLGEISVLLPSEYVDSLKPGKLFSPVNKAFLIEEGAIIYIKGEWLEKKQCFLAQKIESAFYDQSFTGHFFYFRAMCRLLFKRLLYGWGKASSLIISLLSGSREYLDMETKENFMLSGLSHILALSGMHLSFFSGLASKAGKKMFGKKYIHYFRLAAIILFLWFAGRSPSLFRAFLCSLIMILSSWINLRSINSLTVLSFVFIIHSMIFPCDMFELAFLLSYASLAGILLFSECINKYLCRIFPHKISSSLSASVSAQITTSYISIKTFSTLTPVGIISTTVVSPLINLFLTLSIFSIISCLLMPFLSPVFSCILNALYEVIFFTVKFFAGFPPVSFKDKL
jgi:ComEC/Rec2-related protein